MSSCSGPDSGPTSAQGSGFPDFDQVARKPEAAGRERGADPDACGTQPVTRPCDRDHAEGEQAEGREQVELGAECEAGGEARDDQGAAGEDRGQPGAGVDEAGRAGGLRGGAGLSVAVDQDRGRGEQEEEPADVVLGVPGLEQEQHLGIEQDRDPEQGGRRRSVRPPERPGREQAEAHPADVDQRREEVAVEEEDPERVQQLGVLRIEPDGQLQHLGHVQRADLGVLDEAGRERRRCARSCSAGTCRCRGPSASASTSALRPASRRRSRRSGPTALSGGAGSSASLAQSPRLAHSPTPTPAATVPISTQPGL